VSGGLKFTNSSNKNTFIGISSNFFKPKVLGHNWYSIQIQIGEYVPAGSYYLDSISIQDKARNWVNVRLKNISDSNLYFFNGISEWTDSNLPVVKIEVTNSRKADEQAPVISKVKVLESNLNTGDVGTLIFKATDSLSGIDLKLVSGLFYMSSDPGLKGLSGMGPSIQIGSIFYEVKDFGNDLYSIKFDVGKYLPSGEYSLTAMSIQDKAGNINQDSHLFSSVKVMVSNTNKPDVAGPVINEVKLLSSTVFRGETSTIMMKVIDDVSGVDSALISGTFHIEGTDISQRNNSTINFSTTTGKTKSAGGDWYSVEFKIDEFVKPGKYTLRYLTVYDNARNFTIMNNASSIELVVQ
jgi:hypothetical protein